jgi:hypothetical protein
VVGKELPTVTIEAALEENLEPCRVCSPARVGA